MPAGFCGVKERTPKPIPSVAFLCSHKAMSKTTLSFENEVRARLDSLLDMRRDLHLHPELSFKEHRTAEQIAGRLRAAGLEVREKVGCETAVVGVLRGDQAGRVIGWRADIDALPIVESPDIPYASTTNGVMHACGHDGHTAIAVHLAEILASRKADLPGTAVFLFQPAEEVFGGARPMIKAGALENPYVEEVYGLHLTTQTPAGKITVQPGESMASADFFDIEITGEGGHGAYPHLSIDPLTAAANILLGMQNLVSREIPARDTAVLTVGQMQAGSKHNIIPNNAYLRGSIRTYKSHIRDQLVERLQAYAARMAQAYRANAKLTLQGEHCPAVINHQEQSAFVHQCCSHAFSPKQMGEAAPVMASDDMSLFLQARPGCYFRVGIAPADQRSHPHHAPEFLMNEDGLPWGLRAGLAIMLQALQTQPTD